MPSIKKFAMAYGAFVAFTLVTALVVRPIIVKAKLPLLTDAAGNSVI